MEVEPFSCNGAPVMSGDDCVEAVAKNVSGLVCSFVEFAGPLTGGCAWLDLASTKRTEARTWSSITKGRLSDRGTHHNEGECTTW